MINIGILINSLNRGGAERVVSILSQHLLELSENINVILILLEEAKIFPIHPNVEIIHLGKKKLSNLIKFIILPFYGWYLKKICFEREIEVVFSFLERSNFINVISKIYGGNYRVILNERTTPSLAYSKMSFKNHNNKLLIRLLYPRADHIIANSNGVKNDLEEHFHLDKISVIYNPIDIESINRYKKETITIMDRQKISEYKLILYAGRLIPDKRVIDLISAFKVVSERMQDVVLVLLGEGEAKQSLQKRANKLGIGPKVYFLGDVNNPYSWMSHSDCFVLPSQREGFPNVLLEAMACGCPVISTDCQSGPSEIIENKKSGILVSVGDVKKIAEAIEKVLTDKSFTKKMVKHALLRIEKFSIKNIIPQYEKIIFKKNKGKAEKFINQV